MQARFLLGPAGSGKTFRCLAEIRAALRAAPDGPPLILLAPKQATFQLERQLLADPALPGYTRLQILSFERLAEFILDAGRHPPRRLLNDEGRVMVLRALLEEKKDDLRVFRATARLPGFAKQLSGLLRECQRFHLPADRLATLAAQVGPARQLDDKLHDLARLLRAYRDWLRDHALLDADSLLDLATETLRGSPESKVHSPKSPRIAALWLDGFAEMTAQEISLLAAVLPRCEHATLAFCVEAEPTGDVAWLSPWSVVSQTFRKCHARLKSLPGVEVTMENMKREAAHSRFAGNPVLAHLEARWNQPAPFTGPAAPATLRLVSCANPEAEATFAAREIIRAVREQKIRYRDVAVLVRSLDGYADNLRRVFTRFGVPFFLDRRESAAHHPLAELTRGALRTVIFGWAHDDWFGVLKTGFAPVTETEIDELENESLARGWAGEFWRHPIQLPDDAVRSGRLEKLRRKILPPFERLALALAATHSKPTGPQLAQSLRDLWNDANVDETLERWRQPHADLELLPRPARNERGEGLASNTAASPQPSPPAGAERERTAVAPTAVHATVLKQLDEWLKNLELAFPTEALPVREWLPILEAGLANLSVGVIPPALDQVLIGAIDRSRNPELQLAFVLGLNESVFPAAPRTPALLSDADRAALAQHGVDLGLTPQQQIGHERYLGYIAGTRAGGQLVVTYADQDDDGEPLHPSPFVTQLQRLFPALVTEEISNPEWPDSEHLSELVPSLLRGDAASSPQLEALPEVNTILTRWRHWQSLPGPEALALSPAAVTALHGQELCSSVSALETFAACPFKFFTRYGLRADERKLFEADPRETGSFQHEILKEFHAQLHSENKRWRDVTPEAARARIGNIGTALAVTFNGGLFAAGEKSRFLARTLIEQLSAVVAALVGWMKQYEFDPQAVELSFGLPDSPLPAWQLDLGDNRALRLRGKIDRVDMWREPGTDVAQAVVMDYKSGGAKLDPVLLHHGLQLQLLSYLGVLRHLPDANKVFGVKSLLPVGGFYIPLRARPTSSSTRREVLDAANETNTAYQHTGRFAADALPHLDQRNLPKGDQFKYAKKKDGGFSKVGNEALPPEEFRALLDQIEASLRRHGQNVFAGDIAAKPYRKGNERACDRCLCQTICRFDPWVNPFNVLRKPDAPA